MVPNQREYIPEAGLKILDSVGKFWHPRCTEGRSHGCGDAAVSGSVEGL
jgi:hypothetical protein